jgi:hypothetical protein
VIIFSSIRFLSKKVTKTGFLKKNKTKPKPVQTDRFRFGSIILGKNRSKPVWLDFFRFDSVFFGSVRIFWFRAYETELVGFFKILIGLIRFFHGSVFLVIFFPV